MWTEDQVKEYVAKRLKVYYYDTASGIASKAYYAGCGDWRFDKLRAVVFDAIRMYKQNNN